MTISENTTERIESARRPQRKRDADKRYDERKGAERREQKRLASIRFRMRHRYKLNAEYRERWATDPEFRKERNAYRRRVHPNKRASINALRRLRYAKAKRMQQAKVRWIKEFWFSAEHAARSG